MSLDSVFDFRPTSVDGCTPLLTPGVVVPTAGIVANELFLFTGNISYALYGHC